MKNDSSWIPTERRVFPVRTRDSPWQRKIQKNSCQRMHSLNFQTNATGRQLPHYSHNREISPSCHCPLSCRNHAIRRRQHSLKCVRTQASTESLSYQTTATRRPWRFPKCALIQASIERPSFRTTATRPWRCGNLAPTVAKLRSDRNCEGLPMSRNFPFRMLNYARNCQT